MQQELARAKRFVVVVGRVRPRSDVHVPQPRLSLLDVGVAVAQVHVTRAHGLDLRPGEGDSRFEAILDGIVEERLPVVRELQIARLLLGRGDGR